MECLLDIFSSLASRRQLCHSLSIRDLEKLEKCKPAHGETNTCGIFTSQLNAYGRDKEKALAGLLKMLKEALNPSDPSKLHSELVDMISMDKYFEVTQGDVKIPMPKSHILGWTAFALVGFIFLLMVWWFFIRRDKRMDTGSFSGRNSRRIWNRFYKRGQHKSRANYHDDDDVEDDEKSIGVQSFDDGDVLLNANGRPIYHCRSGSVASIYRDETMTSVSQVI